MNAREMKMAPEQLLAEQERQRRAKRERATRVKPKKAAPKKRIDEDREEFGKAAAHVRAGGLCEVFVDGRRCSFPGTDADHVIGGRWKRDMEALPGGQGFQIMCRLHHELKHGPDKPEALAQAREHAIRIASKGLLRHVARAEARYHMKHPERSAP